MLSNSISDTDGAEALRDRTWVLHSQYGTAPPSLTEPPEGLGMGTSLSRGGFASLAKTARLEGRKK